MWLRQANTMQTIFTFICGISWSAGYIHCMYVKAEMHLGLFCVADMLHGYTAQGRNSTGHEGVCTLPSPPPPRKKGAQKTQQMNHYAARMQCSNLLHVQTRNKTFWNNQQGLIIKDMHVLQDKIPIGI